MSSLQESRARLKIWSIVAILFFGATLSAQDSCPADENTFVMYVYEDSDARVLLDQRCEAGGESYLNKVLETAECRCYDKKFSDVVRTLGENAGPIAVTTRKLKNFASGGTCGEALARCEQACIEAASASESCSSIRTAGVSNH